MGTEGHADRGWISKGRKGPAQSSTVVNNWNRVATAMIRSVQALTIARNCHLWDLKDQVLQG